MASTCIAAQLYTVREFLTTAEGVRESLGKVAALGYRAVELAGMADLGADEVRRMCDDAGLIICSRHVRFDRLCADLDAVLREQETLGCRVVAIPVNPPEYRETGESYARFAREASRIAAALEDQGQQLVYHNHDWEFERFGSRTGLEILYAESSRSLGAELDTYWVQHGGGDPAWWIERLAGRCPIVHLKDLVMEGRVQLMAEVGEGNLNWPAILEACRVAGVEWYVVEQDHCRRDPFESLGISLAAVRSWGLV